MPSHHQQQQTVDSITDLLSTTTTANPESTCIAAANDDGNKNKYNNFWNLPDVLFFKILTFIAAPTNRVSILCHTIAPLCTDAYRKVLMEKPSDEDINNNTSNYNNINTSTVWDILLNEDYRNCGNAKGGTIQQQQRPVRRECKRLRRSTIHRVRDAHKLICDNTEIAFFYLSEMVNCTGNNNKLTKLRFKSLLQEYGPTLRLNRPVSSGGLYLVEICRAKHVKEMVILKCIQELVEHWGVVQIDLRTSESNISSQTALCVAAARGLPTVVSYLLHQGASKDIISSGRFALHSRPKKTIRCIHQTALEFAITMRDAERLEGASDASLVGLNKCIQMLMS